MDFSKDFSGPLRAQEKGTGTWGQGLGTGGRYLHWPESLLGSFQDGSMASAWLLALGVHRPLSGQFPGLQFSLGLSTSQIVSATPNPLGFLWREW